MFVLVNWPFYSLAKAQSSQRKLFLIRLRQSVSLRPLRSLREQKFLLFSHRDADCAEAILENNLAYLASFAPWREIRYSPITVVVRSLISLLNRHDHYGFYVVADSIFNLVESSDAQSALSEQR